MQYAGDFPAGPEGDDMLIDCDTCTVRGLACGDCVVTVLLGAPPDGVVLDEVESRAVAVLARGGLIPPLQLVTAPPDRPEQPRRTG
jgi:hypothetical protein